MSPSHQNPTSTERAARNSERRGRGFGRARVAAAMLACACVPMSPALGQVQGQPQGQSQNQGTPARANPIAIVPVPPADSDAKVDGTVQPGTNTKFIYGSGSVTSGSATTNVVLPRRGVLRVCAATTVHLSSDASVPEGETPGLMIALDHGAVETSFATGRNSDVLLTPDFRILIAGPGPADLKVRLGDHGDTCVDNSGANAPYVVVSSVFEGGAYRVQPGQHVMFQRGSLGQVVDKESEPCGCPAAPEPAGNEFPYQQSAGLTLKKPEPAPPAATPQPVLPPAVSAPFRYPPQPEPEANPDQAASGAEQAATADTQPGAATGNSAAPATRPAPAATPTMAAGAGGTQPAPAAPQAPAAVAPAPAPAAAPAPQKKAGVFRKIGRFFRRVFGAE